jgi:hypothetical protein
MNYRVIFAFGRTAEELISFIDLFLLLLQGVKLLYAGSREQGAHKKVSRLPYLEWKHLCQPVTQKAEQPRSYNTPMQRSNSVQSKKAPSLRLFSRLQKFRC